MISLSKVLLVFSLTLNILLVVPAPQAPTLKRQVFAFHQEAPAEPLPPVQLTLSEVVDILTDFDVEHTTMRSFCGSFHGMTNFTARTITLCQANDQWDRRTTILHELIHVLYRNRGIDSGDPHEGQVEEIAEKIFHQIFDVRQ